MSCSRPLINVCWALLLALGVYIGWLDHKVRTRFEGKTWELPARVFSRPLELYAGARISLSDLRAELDALAYQPVSAEPGMGEYAVGDDFLRLHTRGFHFWDGEEAPKPILVKFNQARIESVSVRQKGNTSPIMRLEPREIGKFFPHQREDRLLIRSDEVPGEVSTAIVAIEDRRFYRHFGVDLLGVLRALIVNLRAGEYQQGASTITQQLARNFYLTAERSFWRKLNELLMALLLEAHYGKDDILEAYLNEIYLGQDGDRAIHGVGLAAWYYFGKPLQALELHQYAFLAGIVRGASYYNPWRHPERALQRRNAVLRAMHECGVLTSEAMQKAIQAPLDVASAPVRKRVEHPAFLDLVQRQLLRDYQHLELESEGLNIATSLDWRIQQRAEKTLRESLRQFERRNKMPAGSLQGAVLVLNASNGKVLALVGDRNARFSGFNRALDAKRPVGSLIKPAVYLAALRQSARFNLTTRISDAPLRLRDQSGQLWEPHNFDGKSHGNVSLYDALVHSYNLASIRLGQKLGPKAISASLHSLGVEISETVLPSLYIGAINLSLMDVAQMYQTIANGGFRTPILAIDAVTGKEHLPLKRYGLEVTGAVEAVPSFLLKFALSGVTQEGTAAAMQTQLPALLPLAGKTGTTNDLRDSWFAGFGADYLAIVWIGRDDNQPTGLTGATGALQVWINLMKHLNPAAIDLSPPEGVRWEWVDPATGAFASADCRGVRRMPFAKENISIKSNSCNNSAKTGKPSPESMVVSP